MPFYFVYLWFAVSLSINKGKFTWGFKSHPCSQVNPPLLVRLQDECTGRGGHATTPKKRVSSKQVLNVCVLRCLLWKNGILGCITTPFGLPHLNIPSHCDFTSSTSSSFFTSDYLCNLGFCNTRPQSSCIEIWDLGCNLDRQCHNMWSPMDILMICPLMGFVFFVV